jgi:acyl carrier protein
MKMVDIIFSLEEQFDLTIPFNSNSPELSEFGVSNLRDIVNLMTRLSEEKA